jgi:hypothetical protein
MATSTTMSEMKKMMAIFSTYISNHFDEMNAYFIKLNARLDNIEKGGSKKEREATTKELEVETKRAMETARHAFL